jgi:hypothetical protein
MIYPEAAWKASSPTCFHRVDTRRIEAPITLP